MQSCGHLLWKACKGASESRFNQEILKNAENIWSYFLLTLPNLNNNSHHEQHISGSSWKRCL